MKRSKKLLCLVMVFVFILGINSFVYAADTVDRQVSKSIDKAVAFLNAVQNEDGGFGTREGRPSSWGMTSWVILALNAAGEDVASAKWQKSGLSPISFLKNNQESLTDTTDIARILLTLSSANENPVYNGINLVERLKSFQDNQGHFGQAAKNEESWINAHIWTVLALNSAGCQIPDQEKARKWLLDSQNEDGGFSWFRGGLSDADDTGIALQSLIILGEDPANSVAIKKAFTYLKKCQTEDGGINCGNEWMGSDSNCASTSWALRGLAACGEDPTTEKWTINGNNLVTHLLGLQNANGSFNWKDGNDSSIINMTAYAIIALAQKPVATSVNGVIDASDNAVLKDLHAGYWAYGAISDLINEGVLTGYPDNTFKPDNPVKRAEFAKFMIAGLKKEESTVNQGKEFPDVPSDNWAYQYISISASNGYITGMPDGTFNPNGQIKGSELATMIVRALPAEAKDRMQVGPEWYSGYVLLAEEKGLLYPGFNANQYATRAQCAFSIVQLKNLLGK